MPISHGQVLEWSLVRKGRFFELGNLPEDR